MFRKIIGTAGALALTAAALTACSTGSSQSGPASGGASAASGTIAFVAKGYASPFWAAVKKGAEDAGSELGYALTFSGPDNDSDVTRQNDQLNQALVQRPVALAFAALDSTAQASVLGQFDEAGIPVIAFDSGVPGSSIPKTTVATDNRAAAAEAAKRMSELIGGSGEVAIICQSQTSVTGQDREQGFRAWLADNAPGITVVEVQYNNSDQAIAQQQAGAILQAHPNLVGIFATDDDGAVASAQASVTAGRESKVTIIGFDSGKPQMELIRQGVISGSITQNPYEMGYDAVMSVDKVIKGETVEEFTDSGFAWYDKTNIDDPEIQRAVYE